MPLEDPLLFTEENIVIQHPVIIPVRKTSRMCIYGDCTTRPNFNNPGETKGKYCATHKEEGMVNVISPTCNHPGCETLPNFNNPGETKGKYCATHKLEGMVDVASPTCNHPGCETRPNFNNPGEKKGKYCATHKLEGMVNVTSPTCNHPGCTTSPAFNNPGETKGKYCATHKEEGMVDIKNPTCNHPGCKKQPAFNNPGEKKGKYCATHKEEGMVNVKDPTCNHPGCETRPSYGFPGGKPERCSQHKINGDLLSPNSKCTIKGCKNQALYSNGHKKPLRCEEHKEDDDLNIVEQLCKSCGLIDIVDPEGYCHVCKPGAHNSFRLAKQKRVFASLLARDIPPDSHDKAILRAECDLLSRPDMLYIRDTHNVIIEVDEGQHNDRLEECERTRMINIVEAFQKPVFFIRINPDEFKTDGKKQNPSHNKRMDVLEEHLRFVLDYTPEKISSMRGTLFMKRLFFDGYHDGVPVEWEKIHY